ncbi:MAG: NAD(P)-dependent oxidoreductase [Muribaculaceae bacterium]|nr:NAD(P)-dependent oxidoreductase [Muribaculaceae bacterium]
MRRVFLTGATGVMGMAGLGELTREAGRYAVTVLARPGKRNETKLAPFVAKGVKVIWGDLLDPESIRRGVAEADVVLHVGGMVSPAADWHPEQTLKVNVGAMRLIAGAVKAREEADPALKLKTVYIGSVSQYGDRLPPDHTGGVGDRLIPSKFDAYALSKIEAERVLVEAGLRRWVSLRQTGILHPGLLFKADDPIAFHVPLRGVLEWVTDLDSGRLLERVCRDEVPESFWNDFYNIGGGESYRMTNRDFEARLLAALGCPPPERAFRKEWFALRNFHGIWYTDSDRLEELLHFRSGETAEECFKRMAASLPWYFRLAPLAPAFAIRAFMGTVAAKRGLGPLWWKKHPGESFLGIPNEARVEAAFGADSSLRPGDAEIGLPLRSLGDDEWQCAAGHRFRATPLLIERGGHVCPECLHRWSSK